MAIALVRRGPGALWPYCWAWEPLRGVASLHGPYWAWEPPAWRSCDPRIKKSQQDVSHASDQNLAPSGIRVVDPHDDSGIRSANRQRGVGGRESQRISRVDH